MQVELEAVSGPKIMTFWDDVADPCLYCVRFRRYRLLMLPLSWEVDKEGGFEPQCRGGDTPDFGHAMCCEVISAFVIFAVLVLRFCCRRPCTML